MNRARSLSISVAHLAGDGQTIGPVDTLDNARDVLHGGHQGAELIMLEVREARDDARGDDEDIWRPVRETTPAWHGPVAGGVRARARGTHGRERWA